MQPYMGIAASDSLVVSELRISHEGGLDEFETSLFIDSG